MLRLGKLAVDFVPAFPIGIPGTIRDAPLFRKAAGGGPANIAVDLARPGVATAALHFSHAAPPDVDEAAITRARLRLGWQHADPGARRNPAALEASMASLGRHA